MRSNIWTLPSRAVPSLDSSKKRIIQYKNNHLNEMCWKIAGLDAFGFDALSKDRMFTKKSTPSAIADIRIPKWKLNPKDKHSSLPKTHTTSPYWTKPTRFNCRRLPIRECSPKSMQSHMTTLTTGSERSDDFIWFPNMLLYFIDSVSREFQWSGNPSFHEKRPFLYRFRCLQKYKPNELSRQYHHEAKRYRCFIWCLAIGYLRG